MNRIISILLLLAVLTGLFGISRLNTKLVEKRRVLGITQADPRINAPPLVVFTTVALGGFRGIIADMLWMRSSRLQYERKYFELVQLADWITKLEPRFTDVWAYHAWNLAYNISVLFTEPVDRWRWVRHGISLLRDEGAVYNPEEARLLFELGWFYQHKIGGNSDDAHMYYKQAWASEMQSLWGGERPDYAALSNDPIRLQSVLRDYKLDPVVMQEIERVHGPLDWRMPQAHAIYWATQSKKVGGDIDVVFAERMIYQSLTDAFRRGRLFTGVQGDRFIPSPHLEILPFVIKSYENAIANPAERGTAMTGYQNFLQEAVILLYLYNREAEANQLLEKLKTVQPEVPKNINLTEFVFQAFTNRGADLNQDQAFASVESALYQSLMWREMGDDERAAGYEQLGRLVWSRYMEPRLDKKDMRERTGLPPLSEIQERARQRLTESISSRP